MPLGDVGARDRRSHAPRGFAGGHPPRAQAIGYAQDLGSLEPGKLADLVVLDADPLQDLRNTTKIRYVMKNGEPFHGATIDQIWPQAKPLPPLWWWNDSPDGPTHDVRRNHK